MDFRCWLCRCGKCARSAAHSTTMMTTMATKTTVAIVPRHRVTARSGGTDFCGRKFARRPTVCAPRTGIAVCRRPTDLEETAWFGSLRLLSKQTHGCQHYSLR